MNETHYLSSLQKTLTKFYKTVKDNVTKAATRNKFHYDKRHRDVSFEVGDKCLVFYPTRIVGKSEKLLHPFHGPFTVTRVGSNGVNYDVEGSKDGKKFILDCVHVSRMKRFSDRENLIREIERRAENVTEVKRVDSESDSIEIYEIPSETDSTETEIYDIYQVESDSSDTEIYDYEQALRDLNPVPSPQANNHLQ